MHIEPPPLKKLLLAASALVGSVLVAGAILLVTFGYSKPPERWWYPFIVSVFSDYYTTGPFAMTTNAREDSPAWDAMPALNLTQARMTYAMSRGEADIEIAWLFNHGEWVDSPSPIGGSPNPNGAETALSKTLTAAGYDYDRISREDLTTATGQNGLLQVGQAQYRALLIDNVSAANPLMLANVIALARQGIPVVWLGDLPRRAIGWSDHVRRDQLVSEQRAQLTQEVQQASASEVVDTLHAAGVLPRLRVVGDAPATIRSQRRRFAAGELILLFNEHNSGYQQTVIPDTPFERAFLLDPETGDATEITSGPKGELSLSVPARRSRLLMLQVTQARTASTEEEVNQFDWRLWKSPPESMYPSIRWWWPGNAVEAAQLRTELRSMHAAAFRAVELQTLTIGMTEQHLQDQEQRIYQVGSPAYFDNIKTVMSLAKELGMSIDITLGSGWSSGGPFIKRFAEKQLLPASVDVIGPAIHSAPLPPASEPGYVGLTNLVIKNTIGTFDDGAVLHAVVAGKLDDATDPPTLTQLVDLTQHVDGGNLRWQVPAGKHRIFALYENKTAHNVAASAYTNGRLESPVVDHLDPAGAAEYIDTLANPWLDALAPYKPRAVFIDSFELIGELPWSSVFASTFESMHDYDITPYLPLVFKSRGESKYVNVVIPSDSAYQSTDEMAVRIREDYELTREHLFESGFLRPIKAWSEQRGVQLRVQAHGGYGDYLDSYKIADVPESEALFASGSYDFLKLAASAGNVAGRRFISSESFISLTLDFDALTPDDYYFLAGHAFSAGINRTVYHGYAYHYLLP
ncbi:hypothetical protein BST95_15470 [Halioglobus japonicus]|nr:hypothetical protein BST95_15470 [Halioglobus japonicus]